MKFCLDQIPLDCCMAASSVRADLRAPECLVGMSQSSLVRLCEARLWLPASGAKSCPRCLTRAPGTSPAYVHLLL